MDRQLAVGLGTALVGVAILLALVLEGAVRHPAAASEGTRAVEFVAIGGGLSLVTVGVVAVFGSFLEARDAGGR